MLLLSLRSDPVVAQGSVTLTTPYLLLPFTPYILTHSMSMARRLEYVRELACLPFSRLLHSMGKLLHTYCLLTTSMSTAPLSLCNNTLYVLLSSLLTGLSSLTVDSASFDLLTKPQPTKDPCLLREAYSPSRIPTLLWSLGVGREFHFPRPPTIVSTQWNRL